MTVRVGINGFGRIGRMVFRAAQEFGDVEVVGINDLLDPEYLAYMLKHDSVHGKFKGDIAIDGDTLVVNGQNIRLSAERDPAELKWGDIDVDVVVESTGLFLTAKGSPAPVRYATLTLIYAEGCGMCGMVPAKYMIKATRQRLSTPGENRTSQSVSTAMVYETWMSNRKRLFEQR